MPKLKQPSSLEAIAMKVLVEFAVQFCDQLSTKGTLKMLREGISVIKDSFCNRMTWCSLSEFCTTFLEKFCQKSRDKRHYEAASEIMLDVKFVGLRCYDTILRHLNHQNVHRLRGLMELDLVSDRRIPTIIENYRLNDLTTLILPVNRTDHDLRVIGWNCSKLRVLKLRRSRITDEGLRYLSSCTNLRVVVIFGCNQITDVGVNLLISGHDKLEDLTYGDRMGLCDGQIDGCDFLPSLKKPCYVMKRLCVQTNVLTNASLRSIASMFPNLTHFGTIFLSVEDLSILKSLNNLEGISIKFGTKCLFSDGNKSWLSLKELLTFIGRNIKTLTYVKWGRPVETFTPEQTGLDFIFRSCPNIEYLEYNNGPHHVVIPPFKKLKTLKLKVSDCPFRRKLSIIGEMLNLEVLAFNTKISCKAVKTIVLDDVNFPKLIWIGPCAERKFHETEAIIKNNNLDVEISTNFYRSQKTRKMCNQITNVI